MDFSWSYLDTMRRLVSNSGYRSVTELSGNYYPTSLAFDLNLEDGECDIPVFCLNKAVDWFHSNDSKNLKIVIPLTVDTYEKRCSGAETILKYFSRHYSYSNRVCKAYTPKGEVYYGANGIILAKDFSPLMLATVKVTLTPTEQQVLAFGPLWSYSDFTVHLSPKVFLDDTSMLNKHLAKKGLACCLSQNVGSLARDGSIKVEIDDCSKFLKKPVKPDIKDLSPENIQGLMKDNIGEILEQFSLDYRING